MTIAYSVAFTSAVRVAMILLIMVSGRHSCSAQRGGECCGSRGSCHHRVGVVAGMAMVVMVVMVVVVVAIVLGHGSILLLATAMKYSREDRGYEKQHLGHSLHDLGATQQFTTLERFGMICIDIVSL